MKNVTVNVQIQFDVDSDSDEDIKNEAISLLSSMSQTLARYHMENDPLIFTNAIDNSDIEIHKPLSECCNEKIEVKIHDLDGTNLEEFPTCSGCGEVCQEA